MFKQKLLKCTKDYLRKMITLSFAENIRFFYIQKQCLCLNGKPNISQNDGIKLHLESM